jgi:Cu(I)/Ag(I) efflux system membrane fusion protein
MGKPQYVVLAVLAALGLFVAGRWSVGRPSAASAGTSSHRILYYQDPMHPAYRSAKPGIAPDCGMQLEPVYADGPAPGPAGLPAGAVQVSPEKQQLIGVRTATAEKTSASDTIRLLGRVSFDETQVYRVTTATDGWIRSILPVTVGTVVKKNDLLATFYSREFLTIQQSYFYALNTKDRFQKLGNENAEQVELTNAQIRSAEENLQAMGMGDYQIQAIAKVRKPAKEIELRAPADGLIVVRNVFPGLRFDRGTELYRIADLRRVWILADLFENEARFIRPGQKVRVRYQGRTFSAVGSAALPQFDPASRTLKVRLEMDNVDMLFRPDMFVDVEVPVSVPAAVTVPAEAVVDSGLRKTVYVDRGEGYFEPREVEVSWTLGDHAGIARGLAPGERIVVAGNFLIDSESRMRRTSQAAPIPKKTAAAKDPVCGMDVDPAAAPQSEYRGKTYYFCSDRCKREFDKDPLRYTEKKPAGAGV